MTDLDDGRLNLAKAIVPRAMTIKVDKGVEPEKTAEQIVAPAGMKMSLAIECTGAESSTATAIWTVKFGGKVFMVGVGKDTANLPVMRILTQEIDVQGQYRYCNTWPRAIRPLRERLLDLGIMVTHRLGIDDAGKAFQAATDPKTGAVKVLISD